MYACAVDSESSVTWTSTKLTFAPPGGGFHEATAPSSASRDAIAGELVALLPQVPDAAAHAYVVLDEFAQLGLLLVPEAPRSTEARVPPF